MEIIFEENGDLTASAAVTGGSAAISTGIAELWILRAENPILNSQAGTLQKAAWFCSVNPATTPRVVFSGEGERRTRGERKLAGGGWDGMFCTWTYLLQMGKR